MIPILGISYPVHLFWEMTSFSLRVEYLLPITILPDFEHRKSPFVKLTEGDRFPIVAGVQIEFG